MINVKEKNALKAAFVFFIIIVSIIKIDAQISPPYKITDESGEIVAKFIEDIVIESNQNNENIFVISSLGKYERYSLNKIRLNKIVSRFTKILGVDSKRIIPAYGERQSSNEGKIEFYIGSNLFLVITPRIGRNVKLTSGDIDPKKLTHLKKKGKTRR